MKLVEAIVLSGSMVKTLGLYVLTNDTIGLSPKGVSPLEAVPKSVVLVAHKDHMKPRALDIINAIDGKLFVQMLEINPLNEYAEIEFQHNNLGLRRIVFSGSTIRVEVDMTGSLYEAVQKYAFSFRNNYATLQMTSTELYNMIENNL